MAEKKEKPGPFDKAKAHRIGTKEDELVKDIKIEIALSRPDLYDKFYCDICNARVFPVKGTEKVRPYFRASNHVKGCPRSSKTKIKTSGEIDTNVPNFFGLLNALDPKESGNKKGINPPGNPLTKGPDDEDDNSSDDYKPTKPTTVQSAYKIGRDATPSEVIVNEYRKRDFICYKDNARSIRNYEGNNHLMLIIPAKRWRPDYSMIPPQYGKGYTFLKAYWPDTEEDTEAIYLVVKGTGETEDNHFKNKLYEKKLVASSQNGEENVDSVLVNEAFVILADWEIVDYNGVRFLVDEKINQKTYFAIKRNDIY